MKFRGEQRRLEVKERVVAAGEGDGEADEVELWRKVGVRGGMDELGMVVPHVAAQIEAADDVVRAVVEKERRAMFVGGATIELARVRVVVAGEGVWRGVCVAVEGASAAAIEATVDALALRDVAGGVVASYPAFLEQLLCS